MAIQFARVQYVSRSTGANSCRKAAYNERAQIRCERTGEVFHFQHKRDNVYHEILLPEGADLKFKNSSVLWNAAEHAERRVDSQVAKEAVVALPDDKEISLEDRIELSHRIAKEFFLSKGLAVQIDIHAPHDEDKNWHVHMLATTRRFSADGKSLNAYKARDTDPTIRKGFVTEAELVGEKVRDIQNEYFKEKGLDLRVDSIGIVPQEHLGPVRMRHHMNDALKRSELIKETNEALAKDPAVILEALGKNKAVISKQDIERFISKHVPREDQEDLLKGVFSNTNLIPLYDPSTREETGLYTLKETRALEEKILRFATSLHKQESVPLLDSVRNQVTEKYTLSPEQQAAYDHVTQTPHNLSIIQGRAGVGKSYVLRPIREVHEASGYRVIGLAPTHKVAQDMLEEGFKEATTCHAFLFAQKNQRNTIDARTLLIVDEAAMLSTELQIELFNGARRAGSKVLLVGDSRQLSSIQKGGMFEVLAEKFGSVEITDVKRQPILWQKEVSEFLSRGEVKEAVYLLNEHKRIFFSETKETSCAALINAWSQDHADDSHSNKLILAQRNVDVDALNLAVRDIRRARGDLGDHDYEIMTKRGPQRFAEGDRIQLTETDKTQNLFNGNFGVIKKITETACTILQDNGQEITFNPETYIGLRHGYAGTIYKAQGSTLPKTYVLHDQATNLNNSYVSLTRQTKDVKVFISQEETPSLDHLIQQMGRDHGKEASLKYLTLEEIKERDKSFSFTQAIQGTFKDIKTKVGDHFHKNEAFYQFEKPKETQTHKVESKDPPFPIKEKKFEEVSQLLERRLFGLFKEKHNRFPEGDEKKFLEKQASRTGEYLFHLKHYENREPTLGDVRVLSTQARFELGRSEIIKAEMLEAIDKKQDLVKEDHLRATLYAERLARIEGRMFEEEFRRNGDVKNPDKFKTPALVELQQHQHEQKHLADKLVQERNLSLFVATRVANEILRTQESIGKTPDDKTIETYIKLGSYLEERHETLKQTYKDLAPYKAERTIEFMRRREAEGWLKEVVFNREDPNKVRVYEIQKDARHNKKIIINELKKELSMER